LKCFALPQQFSAPHTETVVEKEKKTAKRNYYFVVAHLRTYNHFLFVEKG